ncbi:TSUP family transporter [Corynebacterium aquilae]|uniref:Probable membrane transporter protein n=1 Tax=Corynebacterium aquilae DSM 44791 TaxID=1431546 RepID=A0A1L7CDA7_9CORY|nr:TSUP family transporter [Corynebacterium aquilae]APT83819.1 membrane protein [Corynebacterium aquilae DSM 44791]
MGGVSLGGLALAALCAGWVDAVIGGGGLILVPVLLAFVPGIAPVGALATNKAVGVTGTLSAAVRLLAHTRPKGKLLPILVVVAGLAAAGGALVAGLFPAHLMRPIVIVLLLSAGIVVVMRPRFGQSACVKTPTVLALLGLGAVVMALGFYDGIFGPGTGMFLIMALTAVLGGDLVRSAAMTKAINAATNLGALAVFIAGGHVVWKLALVLMVANIVGAQLGARTVIAGGARLVRVALLIFVVVMASYLGWMQWGSGVMG